MTAARVRMSRALAKTAPYEVWNAFIGLISSDPPEPFTPDQRAAALAFWYEAELQNGGHLQYFSNRGLEEAGQAVNALQSIGATSHATILRTALAEAASFDQVPQVTLDQYVATARVDPFARFDQAFYDASPSLQTLLESYLESHLDSFIHFEESEA